MQALKYLVIFMAVLIVAGMALLAYGLVTRGADDGKEGFAAVDVPLPPGCSIAETDVSENRLILRFDGLAERGCQQVVVIDMATGKMLGQVRAIAPGP